MADDWLKLDMGIFGNRKIKYLRRLPNGDSIALFWILLLTEARRCNSDGKIFLTESIPYTAGMLAEDFYFDKDTAETALETFEQLDMTYTSDGFITIVGWEDHQNAEGLARIREQTRKRVAKHRENQKTKKIGADRKCVYCGGFGDTVDHVIPKAKGGLDIPKNTVCSCLSCNMQKNDHDVAKFLNDRLIMNETVDIESISKNDVLRHYVRFDYAKHLFVTLQVTQGNAIEEDKEEDKERELEGDIREGEGKGNPAPPYQQIVDLYNSICKSYPSVRTLSESRKKAIKARLNTYTLDDFKTLFEMAEASSFLKGANDRSWTATFDWLIKDSNMAKVLEGNYADRPKQGGKKEIVPDWVREQEEAALRHRPVYKKKTAAEDDGIRARAEALQKKLGG